MNFNVESGAAQPKLILKMIRVYVARHKKVRGCAPKTMTLYRLHFDALEERLERAIKKNKEKPPKNMPLNYNGIPLKRGTK